MVDRNEVIRGLECCLAFMKSGVLSACDDCPYNDDEDFGTCETPELLIADALALLREQEQPKEVNGDA